MPVCVFHSQEITFTFLSNRQSRSYPCELLSLHITQPPIRSNDEWGVHFWIGFSNTSYLLLSLDYRSDAGETSGESKTLVTCQSVKHQVHADVCSGLYQSTPVWLILVRNVSSLGTCRSYAYFEEFLDSERR